MSPQEKLDQHLLYKLWWINVCVWLITLLTTYYNGPFWGVIAWWTTTVVLTGWFIIWFSLCCREPVDYKDDDDGYE